MSSPTSQPNEPQAPQALLDYAKPAQKAPLLGPDRVARLAMLAAYAMLPLAPALFGGVHTRPAPWVVLGVIGLPVAAVALALLAYRDKTAGPAARGNARHALWMAGFGVTILAAGAVVMPMIVKPGRPANRVVCAAHLRQIWLGLQIYANGNRGVFPPSFDDLVGVDLEPAVFVCPASGDVPATGPTTRAVVQDFRVTGRCTYIYALPPDGRTLWTITPSHVVAYEPPIDHARRTNGPAGANVLFGDGTVRMLDAAEARHVIAELGAGFNPPRPPTTQPAMQRN